MNIVDKVMNRLLRRKLAYRAVFGDPDAPPIQSLTVMADLRKFCGIDKKNVLPKSQFGVIDPFELAVMEGRRQVFLHIQRSIKLNEDALLKYIGEQENE